jgi:hypothetical protein
MGFPSNWDQASPGFDNWQKAQDAIALAVCEGTGTQ